MSEDTTIPAEEADRRPRRKRVATVEIPDQIHAIAVLTGRDPEVIIQEIVASRVDDLVARARAALGGAQ